MWSITVSIFVLSIKLVKNCRRLDSIPDPPAAETTDLPTVLGECSKDRPQKDIFGKESQRTDKIIVLLILGRFDATSLAV